MIDQSGQPNTEAEGPVEIAFESLDQVRGADGTQPAPKPKDTFLTLDGIKGESSDKGHSGEIHLES